MHTVRKEKYYYFLNILLIIKLHLNQNNISVITPLHEAAQHEHMEIVEFIVNNSNEINLDFKNKDG